MESHIEAIYTRQEFSTFVYELVTFRFSWSIDSVTCPIDLVKVFLFSSLAVMQLLVEDNLNQCRHEM